MKVVNEPLAAAQAKAHPVAGGETILESSLNICDSGPLVFKYQPYALASRVFQQLDDHVAAFSMVQGIAAEFTGCRNQLGLIDQGKLYLRGPLTHLLPRQHDIR